MIIICFAAIFGIWYL